MAQAEVAGVSDAGTGVQDHCCDDFCHVMSMNRPQAMCPLPLEPPPSPPQMWILNLHGFLVN